MHLSIVGAIVGLAVLHLHSKICGRVVPFTGFTFESQPTELQKSIGGEINVTLPNIFKLLDYRMKKVGKIK